MKQKNKSYLKQIGGLQISSVSAKEAFEHFISNSKITLLSKGSFGLTFVAKLNPDIETYYKHVIWYKYNEPVNYILFKICCLYDSEAGENKENIDLTINNVDFSLGSVDVNEFEKEVNIQVDIYFKSLNYLQPYCPGVIYANRAKKDQTTYDLLLTIANNMDSPENSKIIQSIKSALLGDEFSEIGFIGMEFMQGYDTMFNINRLQPQYKINNLIVGYYLLIKVAIDTGYTHGDFHNGNILININDNNYFHNAKINNILLGAPLLIDFGLSKKLEPEKHKLIKNMYTNKNYGGILKVLCDSGRSDNLNLYNYPHYSWVCKNLQIKPLLDEGIVMALNYIFNNREKQIDIIISIFNKLNTNSKQYPLLPTSNEIKNKLYSGLIDTKPLLVQETDNEEVLDLYKTYISDDDNDDDLDVSIMIGNNISDDSLFKFSLGGKKKSKKNIKKNKIFKRKTRKNKKNQ